MLDPARRFEFDIPLPLRFGLSVLLETRRVVDASEGFAVPVIRLVGVHLVDSPHAMMAGR
jgi:hypothetical protein